MITWNNLFKIITPYLSSGCSSLFYELQYKWFPQFPLRKAVIKKTKHSHPKKIYNYVSKIDYGRNLGLKCQKLFSIVVVFINAWINFVFLVFMLFRPDYDTATTNFETFKFYSLRWHLWISWIKELNSAKSIAQQEKEWNEISQILAAFLIKNSNFSLLSERDARNLIKEIF